MRLTAEEFHRLNQNQEKRVCQLGQVIDKQPRFCGAETEIEIDGVPVCPDHYSLALLIFAEGNKNASN